MTGAHCPRCGQKQVSSATRFCSKCGFLMTGIPEIVAQGGISQEILDPGAESPRRKGVKQGGLLMLSSLIVVPLLAIISASLNWDPTLVAITAVITFWGGLLRILYALIFQSGKPALQDSGFVESFKNTISGRRKQVDALPPADEQPAEAAFIPAPGHWKDTNELQPTSVTEETTRTLDRNKIDRAE